MLQFNLLTLNHGAVTTVNCEIQYEMTENDFDRTAFSFATIYPTTLDPTVGDY